MIIHPEYMNVMDWADVMNLLVDRETPVEKLDHPDNWQRWAMNLVGEPDLIGQNAPDPYAFDDWREWAMRFFSTVELTG
jgi:hypothetical protein